jgi:hypothetical protein
MSFTSSLTPLATHLYQYLHLAVHWTAKSTIPETQSDQKPLAYAVVPSSANAPSYSNASMGMAYTLQAQEHDMATAQLASAKARPSHPLPQVCTESLLELLLVGSSQVTAQLSRQASNVICHCHADFLYPPSTPG